MPTTKNLGAPRSEREDPAARLAAAESRERTAASEAALERAQVAMSEYEQLRSVAEREAFLRERAALVDELEAARAVNTAATDAFQAAQSDFIGKRDAANEPALVPHANTPDGVVALAEAQNLSNTSRADFMRIQAAHTSAYMRFACSSDALPGFCKLNGTFVTVALK